MVPTNNRGCWYGVDLLKMIGFLSRRLIFFAPSSPIECDEREGQSLTEYALLLVPIALVAIAVVALLGDSITNAYCMVTETFTVVEGEPCYEILSQVGDGPVVLQAKYRDIRDGIVLRAKTEGCSGDLTVIDYGLMDQVGDSGNYTITIIADPAPDTFTVGSETCGWTIVTFN